MHKRVWVGDMENDLPKVKKTFYSVVVKRLLDIILSGTALIIFSPLLFVICILELIFHGSPIIYCTKRPGKDGKIFSMYKFRSMTNERSEDGLLLPEAKRLTRFGYFIRKTSIDELPGLINILKGDMSIVGPRALLVEYLPRYSKEQRRRHEVMPGLTGYAQVSGRNSISWEEKFIDDVWYVDHMSFLTDLKIVLKTIGVVFKRKGISSDTSVTMEVFTGSNEQSE